MPRTDSRRSAGFTPPCTIGKERLRRRDALVVGVRVGHVGGARQREPGRTPLAREAVELRHAPVEPAQAALHRAARRRLVAAAGDELVELHDHVGADVALDLHHALRRVLVQRPVDVAAELHAVFLDRAQLGEREHLKPARVGEHWSLPAGERMQPAERAHHGITRTQVQMIGVGEHHPSAHGRDIVHREAAHRAVRAHRHEGRRLHLAVRRAEPPQPRRAGVVGGAEA